MFLRGVELWNIAANEEGEWEKKRCVPTWLPFTFALSVWGCSKCWRSTGEESDSGQQSGTPAWFFKAPYTPLSLGLPDPQLKTHIFCYEGLKQRGAKHIKSTNVCFYLWIFASVLFFYFFNHLILQLAENKLLCLILLVILRCLLFVRCNSASHE